MRTYSHSRLNTYENCPLQFRFKYVDKAERMERESVEAFMGSRVHEVLEKLYADLKYTKLNSLDELLAYYYGLWNKHWHDGVYVIRAGLAPEHYRELGARCVTDYYKRFIPFDQGRVVGIEKAVSLPLDDEGEYNIRGFIDRLDYTGNGVYEIHDYKTSGSLLTQEYANRDRQLALYHMAVEKMYSNVKDVRLIWHYLAFDTDIRSYRTTEQLNELRENTIGLIREIEAAKTAGAFPAREGLCEWCDYPAICPRHKHENEVAALSAREFKVNEGVILVDDYAVLKEQYDALGDKVEQARKDLLAFSATMGVDVIVGSGRKVGISRYTVTTYPGKTDERLPVLISLLKEAGRWDEVSSIDVAMLKDAVLQGGWPTSLIERVNTFEAESRRVAVRLGSIRETE